ncbi:YgfZ/GcvT domain-containing protein [Legionella jamestowniensis]|uniref:Glycine cleavage T protein n=1 Tax=Legionella jamestowniensis TaxID=455 RepID=A0A0W0UK89_9GAMM|nr:folate-binding protein YgfZ [Legionella jamestowniensis]KTD08156.1 glycine cleavage T protein [Legionella jamestowniensis]SFL99193.1 hypothetical protein SAMN02746073_2945 [Legionella jamestowniensis DSM 19215]
MNLANYPINQRPYTYDYPLENNFKLEQSKNHLFELSHLGILRLEGERAQEFLQGQLTCDLRKVNPTTMRQGAQCNLKGRILSLPDVIYWQHFQLVLPNDILLETQTSLLKTAMLSKVTIEPDDAIRIYGFYLSNPSDLLPEHALLSLKPLSALGTATFYCYCVYPNYYIFILSSEYANRFIEPFVKANQYHGSLPWHYQMLKQKQIQIYPETRGLFLPHRLDLHQSDYLSFDKGCYKGQEIIARTHYRAKLKHGLRLFTLESSAPLFAGKRLLDSHGQVEVGELVDFCPLGNNQFLIAASVLLEHPQQIRFEEQQEVISLTNF